MFGSRPMLIGVLISPADFTIPHITATASNNCFGGGHAFSRLWRGQ